MEIAAEPLNIRIRQMMASDWEDVSGIYQIGMDTGLATFETVVPPYREFDNKFIKSPRLVSIHEGRVSGFAALSKVSARLVYSGVAEVTVYVHPEFQSKGIATRMLQDLIRLSERHGFWSLQASIFPQNTASLRLHEKCGFRKVGTRERIARRDELWLDNVIYERRSKTIGN